MHWTLLLLYCIISKRSTQVIWIGETQGNFFSWLSLCQPPEHGQCLPPLKPVHHVPRHTWPELQALKLVKIGPYATSHWISHFDIYPFWQWKKLHFLTSSGGSTFWPAKDKMPCVSVGHGWNGTVCRGNEPCLGWEGMRDFLQQENLSCYLSHLQR